MLNKKKNNKGFTLVELLVVIAIIGILAVVAVPALFKNIEKGKVADLEADISAIRSASLSYYAENSAYPTGATLSTTPATTDPSTKLESEIESLGFPFGGTYILNGTAPGNLTLTINNTTKLSKSAQDKLVNDLDGVTKKEIGTEVIIINGDTK